eukprot:jgi/Picre1/33286/NNA_008610.t1
MDLCPKGGKERLKIEARDKRIRRAREQSVYQQECMLAKKRAQRSVEATEGHGGVVKKRKRKKSNGGEGTEQQNGSSSRKRSDVVQTKKVKVGDSWVPPTTAVQVRSIVYTLFELYPTPERLCDANIDDLERMLMPLGLFRKRAQSIQRFSQEYLTKDWRDDPTLLYGIGKYAKDAYDIFCLGRWREVTPDDKDLRLYIEFLERTDGLGWGLIGVKSDSMMSYWKCALNDFKVNQQDIVKVKKGAMDLAKEFEKMLKMYEKQELSNIELREKLKRVRQEKEMKEKQVKLANRTIERLSVKQGATEAEDAVKDAQIRRMERRLAALKSSTDLKQMCDDLEVRVRSLEQDVRIQEQKADDAEKRARDAEREVALLQRGIQVAAEQMTKSSGSDVSSSMLLAVAKGQEEAVSLSKKLADAQEKLEDMSKALVSARKHLTSQHEALMRWKEWEAAEAKSRSSLQQELEDARAKLKQMTDESSKFNAAYADVKREASETKSALEMEKTLRIDLEKRMQEVLEKQQQHGARQLNRKSSQASPPVPMVEHHQSPGTPPDTIEHIEREMRNWNEHLGLDKKTMDTSSNVHHSSHQECLASNDKGDTPGDVKPPSRAISLEAYTSAPRTDSIPLANHTLFDLAIWN